MRIFLFLCWLAAAVLLGSGLWASKALSVESPARSPLVVPAADCPNLPPACRENRQYDDYFRVAAQKFWPAPIKSRWCWLKAQCCAESGLRPRVTSPVGAKGLCQFMDATRAEVGRQLGRELAPYDARDSIEAGAVYRRDLRKQLTSPRPSEPEAQKIVVGCYNAGCGNIWCGQRAAAGALLWAGISPYLHECTGRHAEETITYVARVSRYSGWAPDPSANDNTPLPVSKPRALQCLP